MIDRLRKITVLYNLPATDNPDDVDTVKSAQGVVAGLRLAGYEADAVGITAAEIAAVGGLRTDLVFNLVEWTGEYYRLGIKLITNLEKAGLPYTGSNPWGYLVSGDKVLMKKLLVENDILTPKYVVLKTLSAKISNLKFPVIVKPTLEHAAIGISQTSVCSTVESARIKAQQLLEQFAQPILVEEYIAGDEAQATVLEKRGRPWVLPPAVFRFQKKLGYWAINTYAAKWSDDWEAKMSHWVEKIDKRVESQIKRLARKCYVSLGGRSYPRVDMRIDPSGRVYVLEVNNNPGIDFDPDSGIAVSAKKVGLDWPGLLRNIVEEAYQMCLTGQTAYDTAVI